MLLRCLYGALRQVGCNNRIVLVILPGKDASSTQMQGVKRQSGQVDYGPHRHDHAEQDQSRHSHHGSEP
jgi:5-deoxy-D-glucuronate isomerase